MKGLEKTGTVTKRTDKMTGLFNFNNLAVVWTFIFFLFFIYYFIFPFLGHNVKVITIIYTLIEIKNKGIKAISVLTNWSMFDWSRAFWLYPIGDRLIIKRWLNWWYRTFLINIMSIL